MSAVIDYIFDVQLGQQLFTGQNSSKIPGLQLCTSEIHFILKRLTSNA